MWLSTGHVPWEVTELYLCRDVYHCTPLELEEVPWEMVERHLIIINAESEL
jgi:hypothetical protein